MKMSNETDEILADSDFADALRESIEQADAGNTGTPKMGCVARRSE